MKPDDRDAAYLWDMRDAAQRARQLVTGMDYAAFVGDERTYLAVERLLENIGEAARHVSPPTRERMSAIPWQGIIGMRNVLAHQYGVVDQRRVWIAVVEGLPKLIAALES
jgi:uncharacterized protein with HEPN domain